MASSRSSALRSFNNSFHGSPRPIPPRAGWATSSHPFAVGSATTTYFPTAATTNYEARRTYVRPTPVIPRASGWLPGIGNTLSILKNPFGMHELFDSYANEGDLVKVRIGPLDAVLVSSLDATRQVLQGKNFTGRPHIDLDDFFREICGMAKGIGLSVGEHWEVHRRIANATLASPKIVQSFAHTVSATADSLVDKWASKGDNAQVTINHDLDAYALDSIGQLAFGEKFNALQGDNNPLAEAVRDVLYSTQKLAYLPMPIYRYIRTPTVKKIEASALIVREKGIQAIDRKRKLQQQQSGGDGTPMGDNYISLMLSTKDEVSGRYLNDAEIMGDVLDIIAAGQETTATMLTWFLHLISKDQELQSQIREEIRTHFKAKAEATQSVPTVTYDDVMSQKTLPLLASAVKETLRLYPSIAFFTRQSTADDQLGDFSIPANTTIMVSPWIIGRSSKVWENPLKFDPTRFSRPFDPFGWIPFSAGRRSCVGMRIALLEAKIAIVKLLNRFEIHPGKIPTEPNVITKLVSIGTDTDITLTLKHLQQPLHV